MNTSVAVDPLRTLAAWIEDARAAGVREPEAMALATLGPDGLPAVRYVLCRGIDDDGITFFTNYDSRKGRELAHHPFAAAAFHWEATRRQVRVEGAVSVSPPEVSDRYFQSRARGSQLAASVSPQSAPIDDLDELRRRQAELDVALEGRPVPRPANWGGYFLRATSVELWISGADRIHDRVRYDRRGGVWHLQRLAP
jgi:pyridoxamine 5'-phosphate oxidase